MSKKRKLGSEHELIAWLRVLLCLVAVVALALVYVWSPTDSSRWIRLLMDIIPSAVVALLVFPVFYWVILRHQLQVPPAPLDNGTSIIALDGAAQSIAEAVTAQMSLELANAQSVDSTKHVISWPEIHAAISRLREQIQADRFEPDVVVSVGRSGAVCGALLAGSMGALPHIGIDRKHRFVDGERKTSVIPELATLQPFLDGKRILLIMAECINGGTLLRAKHELKESGIQSAVKTAVAFCATKASFRPDYFAETHPNRELIFRTPHWTRDSIESVGNPIEEYVLVRIVRHFVPNFIKETYEKIHGSRAEPGVEHFAFFQSIEAPNVFLLHEKFRSREGHDAHRVTPHYEHWRDTVQEWLEEPRKRISISAADLKRQYKKLL